MKNGKLAHGKFPDQVPAKLVHVYFIGAIGQAYSPGINPKICQRGILTYTHAAMRLDCSIHNILRHLGNDNLDHGN